MPPVPTVFIAFPGESPIPLTHVQIEMARVPGVGHQFVISGMLTDEVRARQGTWAMTPGDVDKTATWKKLVNKAEKEEGRDDMVIT